MQAISKITSHFSLFLNRRKVVIITESEDCYENYVLITGASEGFGVELAKVFSRNAHNTILIARSLDKIKKLADEIKIIKQIQEL